MFGYWRAAGFASAIVLVLSTGSVSALETRSKSITGSVGVQTGWVIDSVDGTEVLSQLSANDACQKGQVHDPEFALRMGSSELVTLGDSRVVHGDRVSLRSTKSKSINNRFYVGLVAGDSVSRIVDGSTYVMRPCIMLSKLRQIPRSSRFDLQVDGEAIGSVSFADLRSGLFFTYDSDGKLKKSKPSSTQLESMRGLGYFTY